jgi:hypothetical protein
MTDQERLDKYGDPHAGIIAEAMTSPSDNLLERLERQLANCSDSYEAPSGKIMFRIWGNDLAALLKLARMRDARNEREGKPQ